MNKKSKNIKRKLPMSGSEPTFTCAPFGSSKYVHRTNCYSYALGRLRRDGESNKLQPGNLSGNLGTDFSLASCHPAATRALKDLRKSGMGCEIDISAKCPSGYSKVVLMLDTNDDFHWYRQNGSVMYIVKKGESKTSIAKMFRVPTTSVVTNHKLKEGDSVRVRNSGVWSHKRGTAFPPSIYDASGDLIFDPRTSNNKYGSLNYTQYCSSYCVQRPKECNVKKNKTDA